MTTLSITQIQILRAELLKNSNSSALNVLSVLESCDGNLEATISQLATRFGQDSKFVFNIVDEQCKKILRENEVIRIALPSTLGLIANYLAKSHMPDMLCEELAIIVGIYVELGIRTYCENNTIFNSEIV